MDGDTLMSDQLDLFREEKNKTKLSDSVECRECKKLKPLTVEYFPVERWNKNGDYTLSKLCQECEKKQSLIIRKLRKENIHKLTEDYRCPLCLRNKEEVNHAHTWALDHNHDTGKFRGWLCNRCNVGLRTVEITERTLKYLKGELIDNK